MGLIASLITLPMTGPMKGSLWVARKIHEAAEQQMNDPAAIRAELSRLEAALLGGELTEREYDEAELVLLTRLKDASE